MITQDIVINLSVGRDQIVRSSKIHSFVYKDKDSQNYTYFCVSYSLAAVEMNPIRKKPI